MSRLAAPTSVLVFPTSPPFSNFDFVDDHFNGTLSIRRIFTQARSRGCQTIVVEDVPATEAVEDENAEIATLFRDYVMRDLKRVTFWRSRFELTHLAAQNADDCLGYALLKHDFCPSRNVNGWHVFEALGTRYPHAHNYLTCAKRFPFRVGEKTFELHGVVYCQQNRLNKCCAQVALRSLCMHLVGDLDLPFRRINELAFHGEANSEPWAGLAPEQILTVLRGLGVELFSIDYSGVPKAHEQLPYQKLLYSGIESGCGALLSFPTAGPSANPEEGHIIPVIGHTFNEDTWVPLAEGPYFKIGESISYISSHTWLSSFLAHDDNFGSNFCIPKDYLKPKQVGVVIALHPQGYFFPGFIAELLASDIFYSLLPEISPGQNRWLKRLLSYVEQQRLILRTVPVTKSAYAAHLSELTDWHGNHECRIVASELSAILPDHLWVVEVSIPDLFSTNLRKLGEVVVDATKSPASPPFDLFVMARFPTAYFFVESLDSQTGKPTFLSLDSQIKSHTALITRRC